MVIDTARRVTVTLRCLSEHPAQRELVESTAKRLVVRAGRRGGKTVGAATRSVQALTQGKRVLYATPTAEQLGAWWYEVKRALQPAIDAGAYACNETEHMIERRGTQQRLRGKTAWNADTLRGDYADLLILDEYQLTNEDAWELVGAPMLLDNDGDAIFIYTPPSLRSVGVSKARDPRHASKMFKAALQDTTGRWATLTWTSGDNPYISRDALAEITRDMSREAYRKEILAEDDELEASWLVYRAFREAVCLIDRFPIPEQWLHYSFHDFGAANPAALIVAQDTGTGNYYEWAEYLPGAGRGTAEHVGELKRITQGCNVLMRVGGNHQEAEQRQLYTAHGWPIIEPKVRSVNAQIDKVVGMMELNKIFVFRDLHHRVDELRNCLWAPDEMGKPSDKIKDEARYHLSAAARYGYSQFTPETVVTYRAKAQSYL